MLKFKEFLNEGGVPVVSTQREVKANLDDPNTIDELNRYLVQVTGAGFVNPYGALQTVSKTLSTYGILLPHVSYLPEPSGEEVFEVEQWGVHPGYSHRFDGKFDGMDTEQGIVPYQNVKTAPEINNECLYVYFCYDMNENGTYDVFCMVIDKEGLDTIVATEDVNEEKRSSVHSKVHSYMKKVDSVESLYKSAAKEHPVKTVVSKTLRDFGLKK